MKERTNRQKLVIHLCGFQSAPLVSRLALAKWLCQLRPCVVSLWFIDVVIITCWEKVGTTCVSAHTTRIEREVIGLHLLAFSSATFRCQCESSRIQHFAPLGANATFQRFLNTAVGSTVVENWFPLINPAKRRFMYKPG